MGASLHVRDLREGEGAAHVSRGLAHTARLGSGEIALGFGQHEGELVVSQRAAFQRLAAFEDHAGIHSVVDIVEVQLIVFQRDGISRQGDALRCCLLGGLGDHGRHVQGAVCGVVHDRHGDLVDRLVVGHTGQGSGLVFRHRVVIGAGCLVLDFLEEEAAVGAVGRSLLFAVRFHGDEVTLGLGQHEGEFVVLQLAARQGLHAGEGGGVVRCLVAVGERHRFSIDESTLLILGLVGRGDLQLARLGVVRDNHLHVVHSAIVGHAGQTAGLFRDGVVVGASLHVRDLREGEGAAHVSRGLAHTARLGSGEIALGFGQHEGELVVLQFAARQRLGAFEDHAGVVVGEGSGNRKAVAAAGNLCAADSRDGLDLQHAVHILVRDDHVKGVRAGIVGNAGDAAAQLHHAEGIGAGFIEDEALHGLGQVKGGAGFADGHRIAKVRPGIAGLVLQLEGEGIAVQPVAAGEGLFARQGDGDRRLLRRVHIGKDEGRSLAFLHRLGLGIEGALGHRIAIGEVDFRHRGGGIAGHAADDHMVVGLDGDGQHAGGVRLGGTGGVVRPGQGEGLVCIVLAQLHLEGEGLVSRQGDASHGGGGGLFNFDAASFHLAVGVFHGNHLVGGDGHSAGCSGIAHRA